jgi:hypothetical protein
MRSADLSALIAAASWLGGNIALVITATVMFSLASADQVEASTSDVGELFGPVFSAWTAVGGGLLAIIVPARIASWIARLRRRTFTRGSLVGVALLVVVITTYVLGAIAIEQTETARGDWERATETAPERVETLQAVFRQAHRRSERLMGGLTAGLAGLVLVLAGSLWLRGRTLPASALADRP